MLRNQCMGQPDDASAAIYAFYACLNARQTLLPGDGDFSPESEGVSARPGVRNLIRQPEGCEVLLAAMQAMPGVGAQHLQPSLCKPSQARQAKGAVSARITRCPRLIGR